MRSFQIQDNKDFMKKLLIAEDFDSFLLLEASITTYATFHVDGRFHADYFSTDQAQQLISEQEGYALWKRVRPFFFDLVKGKNTPLQFHIVFRLPSHNTEKLLTQNGVSFGIEHVDGLFLNIHFDGSSISCISGSSMKVFTMDKTLEHLWDDVLENFFRRKEIPFC